MIAAVHRVLRTTTRRALALGIVAAITAAVLIVSWPRSEPAAVPEMDETITAPGGPGVTGTVSLDAGMYLPQTLPAPAVILAHGFGQSRADVVPQAEQLARDGFVVLAYSARGFGASTGQVGLDSLDYEVPDARAVVDWLSTRSEVVQDGPGDPRVGVTGGSYGGALSLMLAGTDPRIDAVAAIATWNNLTQALFPNNGTVGSSVMPDPVSGTPAAIADRGDGVFKKSWAATLMSSLLAGGAGAGAGSGTTGAAGTAVGCGRMMPALCQAYSRVAQTGRLDQDMSRLLARSSPSAVVSKITAPTLLVQGERDTLFGLDQADATARAIAAAGTTVAVSWYAGGHDGGAPDQGTENRITEWLRHYLFGTGPVPSTAFRYTVSGPVSDTGQARNRTLEVPSYPGLRTGGSDGTPRVPVTLTGGPQVVINPPGGVPAAISSLPGAGSLLSSAAGQLSVAVPGQTAAFTSAPVGTTTVITGSPRITLTVSGLSPPASGGDDGSGVLYVSLASTGSSGSGAASGSSGSTGEDPGSSDSSSDSSSSSASGTSGIGGAAAALLSGGTLAGNAVAPVRIPALPADGSAVQVTVDLPAVSFQLQAGDSIQVRVGSTDQAYAGSTVPAAYRISLSAGAMLSVPEVGGVRVSAGEEPIGVLIGLVLLVIAGVVGLVLAGRVRSRRSERQSSDLGDVGDRTSGAATDPADDEPLPLVIRSLRKAYPGGVTAVADVSFQVRRGQVLGLLGPNGAGKTTTLRMAMGLITPSTGSISVFGSTVRPGAEILSRIGCFVEGAGFLPHLSGRTNLELFWRATGRSPGDAHIEEALQIADLGTAVNRKVKTYSHGMRQRLAIAQAMLGLPDLLILDEPTNGLDPPQIHAMREVLRRYADTGRTVVISSHLLAEVEQTCTHVVIVNKGRTIASGTVAEMVAASGEMVIGVAAADAARAAAILSALDGAGAAVVTNGGVQIDLGTVTPSRALRALLHDGVEVLSAAPRNRLEDVFLDLVSGADPVAGGPDAGAVSPAPVGEPRAEEVGAR